MSKPIVGVVMGSQSDLPVVKKAFEVFEQLSVPFEGRILSAHRTPDAAADYAKSASDRGLKVIIGAAGRAAHLPGVLASHTLLPVIGLPIGGGPLAGVDALYAIVQMPSGIPVASVAIDGATNAALLAVQIIAIADPNLRDRFAAWRKEQTERGLEADRRIQSTD